MAWSDSLRTAVHSDAKTPRATWQGGSQTLVSTRVNASRECEVGTLPRQAGVARCPEGTYNYTDV